MEECSISERSAYRYLNTISEANVPLFFDAERRGYRLNVTSQFTLGELTIDDGVLVILGMNLLKRSAGPRYRARIDDLLARVGARQPYDMDEFARIADDSLESIQPRIDVDLRMTLAIIHVAIHLRRGLVVELEGNGMDPCEVTLAEPVLDFHGDWQLRDRMDKERRGIAVRSIRYAHVK